jgi:hypothetical protein
MAARKKSDASDKRVNQSWLFKVVCFAITSRQRRILDIVLTKFWCLLSANAVPSIAGVLLVQSQKLFEEMRMARTRHGRRIFKNLNIYTIPWIAYARAESRVLPPSCSPLVHLAILSDL